MSAALKQKPLTPTPYSSPERAQLAHAIAAAADADGRKAALAQAAQTADAEVLRAIGVAEAAEAVLAEAGGNAIRHVVDKALGTAAAAPATIRQARAAVIEAQDQLEECRATRAALKAELDRADTGLSAHLVTDAATAVVKSEMRERAIALAGRVAELQRQLVEAGSGLEWLSRRGVFQEPRGRPGAIADSSISATVQRMALSPDRWALGTVRYATSFAEPVGAQRSQAAFEALKLYATAALPDGD